MGEKAVFRILGIDPGTLQMGYGLIEATDGADATVMAWGVITASPRLPLGERLHHMYLELVELTQRHAPEEMAVEEPFVAKNVKTAMAVGQAQGVALMAAAARGITAVRYTPTQAKHAVTGYGGASKEQVQQALVLHLRLDAIPEPEDAADALAVALCHCQALRIAALLEPENLYDHLRPRNP